MTLEALLRTGEIALSEHPAMKFANDAVTLQAVRSGTGGYMGEEHLGDFLKSQITKAYRSGYEEGVKDGETMTKNSSGRYLMGYEAGKKDSSPKVGMLRQWLNEDRITDPTKMVTNEDLEHFLRAGS